MLRLIFVEKYYSIMLSARLNIVFIVVNLPITIKLFNLNIEIFIWRHSPHHTINLTTNKINHKQHLHMFYNSRVSTIRGMNEI